MKKLSTRTRNHLKKKHRAERDYRVRDRIKAVLMHDDGYSYTEIGKVLLLDDETIRRHISDYFVSEKLDTDNGGGQSYLNEKESLDLLGHLDSHTYRHVKEIISYVKSHYGVIYSHSGMRKWLKSYNFRYKKPHAVPGKADKQAQKAFIAEYEKLKQKAGKKEPIYFVDSVHPEHQTRLAYGWILKGVRKEIGTTARQHRLNYMGGICLSTQKIVYESAEKINETSIQSFLYRLRRQHVGKYKVHVIWDNAGYHNSKLVREFAKELGIIIHYLPAYSPNLNPIERLWKLMHEQVTYNRYYETFSEFTEAIKHFFRHIGKKKRQLSSRITDNFQLLGMPNFAS